MNETKRNIMSIIDTDGSIDEVEVILNFEFKDNGNEYVIYTKNEKDGNGNVTIYVSRVFDRNSDNPRLESVEDDKEWTRIKDLLRELSKIELS